MDMTNTTHFTPPTRINRLTAADYEMDICKRYRWKAYDPETLEVVAALRGDAAQSGRMLDDLIYKAFLRGRIQADDLIVIDDHDLGEIDRFTIRERCPKN